MATRSRTIPAVTAIRKALRAGYLPDHPQAEIDVYRYNSACVRVRIIDPDFAGKEIDERERMVWPILWKLLPESVASQISVLYTVPPEERDEWPINRDFDTRRTERG